jgi:hypothetical protein
MTQCVHMCTAYHFIPGVDYHRDNKTTTVDEGCSSEDGSYSASENISHILWNPRFIFMFTRSCKHRVNFTFPSL